MKNYKKQLQLNTRSLFRFKPDTEGATGPMTDPTLTTITISTFTIFNGTSFVGRGENLERSGAK